jgi:hypothetical protein
MNGFVIAGFSSGYVVVISTDFKEIGREQYCARVIQGPLKDASYSPRTFTVAACGTDSVKLVNLRTWVESGRGGSPERAEWSQDGKLRSVPISNGCLYNFRVNPFAAQTTVDSALLMLVRPISCTGVRQTFVSICYARAYSYLLLCT